MKKCVRAVTAVLAVVLAVIYGLVGFGCWALPDTVRTGGGDAAYFGGLYTVSGGRTGAVDARQETAVSGTAAVPSELRSIQTGCWWWVPGMCRWTERR